MWQDGGSGFSGCGRMVESGSSGCGRMVGSGSSGCPYLPMPIYLHAGQFHSFCRILLTFAGQYCTTAPRGEFRHSEVNSDIYHKLKTQILFQPHCGCYLLAHFLGNFPFCGWHSSDPRAFCHGQPWYILSRGVGNEQFWRTRFPDFSLISP